MRQSTLLPPDAFFIDRTPTLGFAAASRCLPQLAILSLAEGVSDGCSNMGGFPPPKLADHRPTLPPDGVLFATGPSALIDAAGISRLPHSFASCCSMLARTTNLATRKDFGAPV